eukprot:scaffold236408_cov103-Cyclotella_meneghiniana.AAC.2
MIGSEPTVTVTSQEIGRNFCVQDCTASGENDVNRQPQHTLTQDTTSQDSTSEELNSIDYHDAAPILSNKQIENSQLDDLYDIHKKLLSDETTSQESNTSEEPEIENSHDNDGQHTHRPPHHTEKDSLSTLSSSDILVDPVRLFKYRKAGTDDEGNEIFNIISVKHPHLHLSLSTCSKNADVLLLEPNKNAEQHQKWIIKGASIVNLCESGDNDDDNQIKKGSLSIDISGASPGVTIKANKKNDVGGQKWTVKSNDV